MEDLHKGAFYAPFNAVLVKGDESDGNWNVYLEASNESKDLQDEVVFQKALKEAANYFLSHGVLSWDHKHKILSDPTYIIGEPKDVAFAERSTFVKGVLYKKNRLAQGLFEDLLSGSTRFGSSVGGYVLEKSDGNVKKVIWDETAITHKPVNDTVLGNVSVVPFNVFAKALMAGSGVDASSFSGGRALTGESLQGAVVDEIGDKVHVPSGELKDLFDTILSKIASGEIISFNDVISTVLERGYDSSVAADIIQFLSDKITALLAGI